MDKTLEEKVMNHKNGFGETLAELKEKYKDNPTMMQRLKKSEELIRKMYAQNE
jgi:hypothetical protein